MTCMKNNRFMDNTDWKKDIPIVIDDEHPEYVELYNATWEIVTRHVKNVAGMPQTPYMDEGFCDTDIWIWDSCFMSLFCKYAPKSFPGIETLNNFYEVLYGNAVYPMVIPGDVPEWTGAIKGKPIKLVLHIADNPPLFAWVEYSYAMMTGDVEHVKTLLSKEYLQKHYHWLNTLMKQVQLPQVRCITHWRRHEKGFFWEGGRSGMDNTPRGKLGETEPNDRPNNPNMLWVDAISQQCLSALYIAKLYSLVGDVVKENEWLFEHSILKDMINKHYWDAKDKFYYDIDARNGEFMKVITPAPFWAMLALVPDAKQAKDMLTYIKSTELLGGRIPWVSLARNDADFDAETGNYWRGALWLPAAYMGLKGITQYGMLEQAYSDSDKIIRHMYNTWKSYTPHTIWECYAPNSPTPARSCDEGKRIVRPDFCGWSALGPIALYIENNIGLYEADAFNNTLKWHISPKKKGRFGVKNYCFGNITCSLIYHDGVCKVSSNNIFKLIVNSQEFKINKGENLIKIQQPIK